MIDKNSSQTFIASFPYYGLPVFPSNCSFNFNTTLFLRDMFACTCNGKMHHYEYPKFQDFSYDSGCMRRNIPTIIKKFLNNFDVYILFRTTLYNESNKRTYISGYYKVSKVFKLITQILGKKPYYGFISNENVFLEKKDANEWKFNFNRGAIYSTNEKYKDFLQKQLEYYKIFEKTSKNKNLEYQKKTIEMINKLKSDTFRKQIQNVCLKCLNTNCFLKNKILNYQKKRGNLNHLDNLYDPEVFLTDFIEILKKENIEYLNKGDNYLEM